MKLEDLRRYQREAGSTRSDDPIPVRKEDLRWFLKCVEVIEEMEIKTSALVR